MNNYAFFDNEVPEKINCLKAEAQPAWGTMTASELVDHLRKAVVLSIENTDGDITTPEEKLPTYKAFLMSDRPFGQNLREPEAFDKVADFAGDLEERKAQLHRELKRMKGFFEQNPGHRAIHPSFGNLNTAEWLHLHKKHFSHHFHQFGLI